MRIQLLDHLREHRAVVHFGVLAVVPETDQQRPIVVQKGQFILEAGLLAKHRQDLRLEQLNELLAFSFFQLNVNIARDFQVIIDSPCRNYGLRQKTLLPNGEGRGSTPYQTSLNFLYSLRILQDRA